jgi:hypothetical protein
MKDGFAVGKFRKKLESVGQLASGQLDKWAVSSWTIGQLAVGQIEQSTLNIQNSELKA